jgi:FlaA1/EpsC-like NDP-sugar epimerase
LGYKESGANVVSLFKKEWALGYEPVAIFDYRLEAVGAELSGVDERQGLAVVVDLAREHGVDTAILAMPNVRREQLARLSDQASLSFRQVIVIPNLGGITNAGVVARYFAAPSAWRSGTISCTLGPVEPSGSWTCSLLQWVGC